MNIQIIGDRYVLDKDAPRIGGTSQVYKAHDHVTGKRVAVKIFKSDLQFDLLQEFFLRETESLATLKHPNIVEMKASGFDQQLKKFYIVLE